jgi:adenylate cyclase
MRGDECLVVFSSALEAVRCALAVLDALEHEPDLDLHLGIHVGDIVRVGDEVSGDGVNVARRLCALPSWSVHTKRAQTGSSRWT